MFKLLVPSTSMELQPEKCLGAYILPQFFCASPPLMQSWMMKIAEPQGQSIRSCINNCWPKHKLTMPYLPTISNYCCFLYCLFVHIHISSYALSDSVPIHNILQMAVGRRANTWPVYGQSKPSEANSMIISEPDSNASLPSQGSPFHHWDTQATFIPMFPALRYISRKLIARKLYIALIVTDYGQNIMPAWPIPRSSQIIFTKIVTKACQKFRFGASWMNTLASTAGKRGSSKNVFDISRFDPYLIHRSLVQHEVIFGSEGLTLLSVDHIYTFKHFVGVLSRINWVPLSRVVCLTACIELLHRINSVYTGQKPLKGYFLRIYKDIEINADTLAEICKEYDAKHGSKLDSQAAESPPKDIDASELNPIPLRTDSPTIAEEFPIPQTKSPTIAIPNFPLPPHSNKNISNKTIELSTQLEIAAGLPSRPLSISEGPPQPLQLPKFISDIESPISSASCSSSLLASFSEQQHSCAIVTYPSIKGVSGVPLCSSTLSPLDELTEMIDEQIDMNTPPTAADYYLDQGQKVLCSRCRRPLVSCSIPSSGGGRQTTTILGSEWESFRTIGFGVYTPGGVYWESCFMQPVISISNWCPLHRWSFRFDVFVQFIAILWWGSSGVQAILILVCRRCILYCILQSTFGVIHGGASDRGDFGGTVYSVHKKEISHIRTYSEPWL